MPFGGEIQLVRWPEGERTRRARARAGRPCLLLIEPDELPPVDLRPTEDWVRTTADPIEVHLRGERLRRAHEHVDHRPRLDDSGILRFGGRWVALGAGDVPVVATLVTNLGQLVPRDTLRQVTRPAMTNSALSVRLFRLRPALASVGLAITTIRSRGFVLDVAPLDQLDDAPADLTGG
jgi:hypothetical protein